MYLRKLGGLVVRFIHNNNNNTHLDQKLNICKMYIDYKPRQKTKF